MPVGFISTNKLSLSVGNISTYKISMRGQIDMTVDNVLKV